MSKKQTSDNSNSLPSGEQLPPTDEAAEQQRYQQFAEEIIEMSETDQAMRKSGNWNTAIDIENTDRLKEIIEQIGWPKKSQVGALAAHRAWLLAQHADHDRAFQKSCLELMQKLPVEEVAQTDIAYLEDRVRVGENRPQLYGTQFYTDKQGGFGPMPIEDPEDLEYRRKKVGLKPFAQYRKRMEEKQAARLHKGPQHLQFDKEILGATIAEIPTDFDPQASAVLEQTVREQGLFLLGEMHGVQENPAIIYTLMKKFSLKGLALEWNKGLSTMVNSFLRTGEVNFSQIEREEDGRITAAHFALFKKLRSEGLLSYLLLYDEAQAGSWDRRDEWMASNILKGRSADIPTLVVAGNFHTITEPVYFETDHELHHPMGEHLWKAVPALATGRITYREGQFYNFGIKTLPNKTGQSSETNQPATSDSAKPETQSQNQPELARFYRQDDGLYIFELPEAHAAVVPKMSEVPEISNEPNAGTQQLF